MHVAENHEHAREDHGNKPDEGNGNSSPRVSPILGEREIVEMLVTVRHNCTLERSVPCCRRPVRGRNGRGPSPGTTTVDGMRVATWNVNSIRSRVGRVVDWLVREDVDVLGMQEIKCTEAQFPFDAFTDAGYEVALHGLNQWNGVAFASRLPLHDVTIGFDGAPGFGKALEDGSLPIEARAIGVTVDSVRLWSLYVPNGRELDNPHYPYKLEWLSRLTADTAAWLEAHPGQPLALMGDFNIAPLDTDVWDIEAFAGRTHVSAPEREAFAALQNIGLVDALRSRGIEGYTYWDYQQLRFPRNEGMHIDFILGSSAFDELIEGAQIHREERKGDGPSDHVPLTVDLATDPEDDDDRPMFL